MKRYGDVCATSIKVFAQKTVPIPYYPVEPKMAKSHPSEEAKEPLSKSICEDVESVLHHKYYENLAEGEKFRVKAFAGEHLTLLNVSVGTENQGHFFELFVEKTGENEFDGGFGLLIDYFDGIMPMFFKEERNAWLPLDFTKRVFEGHSLFVRHEFRNYQAEKAADQMLSKKAPK